MSWQPIETAPRDGQWLLVAGRIWAGEISGVVTNDKAEVAIARFTNGRSDFPGDDWWNDAGGDYYATWCRPTHWQPLPAAPEQSS